MSWVCAAASMGARKICWFLNVLVLLLGSGQQVLADAGATGDRVALGRHVHLGVDAAAPTIPTFTPREIVTALVLVAFVVLLSVVLRDVLRRNGRRHPY